MFICKWEGKFKLIPLEDLNPVRRHFCCCCSLPRDVRAVEFQSWGTGMRMRWKSYPLLSQNEIHIWIIYIYNWAANIKPWLKLTLNDITAVFYNELTNIFLRYNSLWICFELETVICNEVATQRPLSDFHCCEEMWIFTKVKIIVFNNF